MKLSLLNKTCYRRSLLLILSVFVSAVALGQPIANFSASPVSGCAPLAVTFTDQSTGAPTAWQWDLGNGTLSSQQNPTTTYFNSGLYTISLTVTNASGSNTFSRTQYIKVDDKPTVDFAAPNTSGCFPLRVNFTDLSAGGSAGITNWDWDFGDGVLSTAQNPFHIYTVAGNYTVTLKVTNGGGCSKVVSRPNFIQVSPGVTVNFNNTTPTQCKPPETINFTNLSTGPGTLTYQWDFGDGGTSFVTSPSYTYLTGGSFTVSLITQSSAGCVDTLTKPAAVIIRDVVSDFTGPASICQGVTANFLNTSIPASASSFWDFGDATFSALTNPTKVYTTPGVYNVKLKNNYGTCADSITKQITVLGLPTPDFNAPDVTDCNVPFTVNFNNLSTGGTSWSWDFGDGGTSTQQNPSHTYTTLGNYTVKLVATGANGCSDSITKNQFVQIQKPVVNINGLPLEGCIPFTISPTPNVNAVDGVATYNWDFGDGGTSALQNPTHTYLTQGTYTVKLFITTTDGCIDSSVYINAVKAGNKSIANFNAVPTAQCVGKTIQFTNLTVPSDRWSWDFGDAIGTSTSQNPIYTYLDTGRFSIRLIAWNNGCPDTLVKTNYITALPPVARFTSTFNCNNKLQVTFTDQSVLPQTWAWDFGDGATSALQNPVHTYAAFGNYNVSLKVTNGGCDNTKIIPVSLFSETANFTVADDIICNSEQAVYEATGMNFTNIASYFWDYGDGSSSFGGAIVGHTYALPGLYTVSLTITDTRGCISTIVKPNLLRVWGPVANFSFSPIAGCRPLNVNFTDLTNTDGVHPITNWLWNFGDGNIQNFTTPPFNHIYTTNGLFNAAVTVTDSYGCSNTFTNNNQIFVSYPKAIFSTPDSLTCVGKNVVFTNASTGIGLNYNWDFGDATSSTITNPVKVFGADGDYRIQLIVTDINGCKDTAAKPSYVKVHTVKAAFTVNDSLSSCAPFEVIFTNTSLYSTSATWIFGDGTTSTLSKPTHYYSTPGTYIARLAVAGPGGCVDTVNKTIILYPSTATLTYTPLAGCSPLPVSFHVSTPGPVKYLWDFNDGNTLATTDSNLVYNYLLPGQFIPKVILEDQTGCQIPVTGTDTIKVTKSYVNFGVDDSLFCDAGIANFSDSTTSNGIITAYDWNFGDGGTSTIQNPSHNYTTTGLYTVRLIVTTANGCSDTAIKTNYIKVVASPVIDIAGNVPICMQSKLLFKGIVVQPDTSKITWYWDFGNGKTSITQNPLPQRYDTAGNYPLRLIVTNSSGCADTVDRTVVVYPLPQVDAGPNKIIGVGSSVAIIPTGSPVVDYLWSPAIGLSCTSCYNTIASPKNTTTYTIKVTDANGCINTDNITIIVVCNDKNVFIPNTFSPNNDGVNDVFYPRGTGLFAIQSMRIFNRWGEMVFQKANLFPNDPAAGWNGRYNGRLQNSDVYTYIIEIICENSQLLTYKGNITLIQ
ncbi:PKD domain-containing protein [Ferruginibacter sp. SUN106]|uniref:PKD domain-containing protein n=1 Tax=Ferruginibacter sp. SUN106 TaxID=2978348 RepID=UPI003D35A052